MISLNFDRQTIDQFTEGDCWLLAWELHTRGGWPIVVMCRDFPQTSWEHVFVEVEPGRYLDIEGFHSAEELEQAWSCRLVPLPSDAFPDFETYVQCMTGGDMEGYRYYELDDAVEPWEVADEIMKSLAV